MPKSECYEHRIQQAVDRMQESGAAAVSGLVDLTSQRLLRFATTITRNQHDAEDALQAVYVRLAAAPDTLGRAREPWHYLLRMVRNESLMVVRRRRRMRGLSDLCDLLINRQVDVLEQEDRHRKVWAALRRIPREQSEVVVLKIWEELTFAQVAEVLDLTPSTAASRYRYAIAKLGNILRSHQMRGAL